MRPDCRAHAPGCLVQVGSVVLVLSAHLVMHVQVLVDLATGLEKSGSIWPVSADAVPLSSLSCCCFSTKDNCSVYGVGWRYPKL